MLARRVARFGPRFSAPSRTGDDKDVKNTDRSHDVDENKATHDTMSEKRSDIVSECARFFQNLREFGEQKATELLSSWSIRH